MSLRLEMHDAQGALLQAPPEPFTYLHGGYGGLLAALERSLEGRQAGDEVRVQLEPEQAFGDYDPELVRLEPIERYGDGLKVGMEIEEDDAGESRIYTVTDIADGKAVLDGNHPLAGIALRFYLKILAVREAKAEEIARGVSLP
ncbi:MAG: peptidylprolyl isomerase [Betaproteobacteria bacterium]|nr:peptidylprolyl isomerase [Betaproteobacteria bacterium]